MILEPELTTDDGAGVEITVGVAEYLSFWGCDPCYDRAPRMRGDGYTFYNYDPEKNSREYLQDKLLPAIERQLQDTTLDDIDRENFTLIQQYVKATLASMADPDREPIINGMARALFVLEWSDREDEQGRHYPGQALEHVAPATPREAYNAAHNLAGRFEQLNGYDIRALLWQAAVADGKPHADPGRRYAEDFGHYLAMQALGHGVSWWDDHAKFPLRFPRFEFHWEPEALPCSST